MTQKSDLESLTIAGLLALETAREKHPVFAEGQYEALGVIREEIREFTKAVEKESALRAVEEAMDAKATLERFILGEHLPIEQRGFGWWERVK